VSTSTRGSSTSGSLDPYAGPAPGAGAADPPVVEVPAAKAPLYWRLLHLQTLRPNGWQRAVLVEGVLTVAVVLTLADVASAWTLLVLPLASMVFVKGHDLLATALRPPEPDDPGAGSGHANGATPQG
jgi:hypothetical protein